MAFSVQELVYIYIYIYIDHILILKQLT